jgi:hypothetical protein
MLRRSLCLFALAVPVVALLSRVSTGAAAADAPAVDVRRIPNNGFQPDLAVGRDGAIHLVYYGGDSMAGDIFYVRSKDGGVTFSSAARVNSQPGSAIARGTIRGPQIAVGPDGRVHVAWNGSDTAQPRGVANPKTGKRGSPMLYSRSGGEPPRFEPQRNLMTHTFDLDGGGSIAAGERGAVYVVWHGNDVKDGDGEAARRVWLARSSDSGATFAAETAAWSEPTGACGCCGMRLLADGDSLRILYRSATAQINRDIFSLLSSDRGRTFTGSRLHEWDINACPMTSMSIASQGARVVGAWETDGQVYFTDLGASGAAPRAPARTGTERRKHPRLAIDKDGRVLMAWTEAVPASSTSSSTHGHGEASLSWQIFGADGQPIGAAGSRPGVPPLSLGVVAARPGGGFVVFY